MCAHNSPRESRLEYGRLVMRWFTHRTALGQCDRVQRVTASSMYFIFDESVKIETYQAMYVKPSFASSYQHIKAVTWNKTYRILISIEC